MPCGPPRRRASNVKAEAETLPLDDGEARIIVFHPSRSTSSGKREVAHTLQSAPNEHCPSCWRHDLNLHRALDRRGKCLRDAPTNSFEHGCVGRFLIGTSGKNKLLSPITETLLTPLLER